MYNRPGGQVNHSLSCKARQCPAAQPCEGGRASVSPRSQIKVSPENDSLALLTTLQGKFDEAQPLYERCQAIKEKILGPENPSLMATLHNRAELLQHQVRADGKHSSLHVYLPRTLCDVECFYRLIRRRFEVILRRSFLTLFLASYATFRPYVHEGKLENAGADTWWISSRSHRFLGVSGPWSISVQGCIQKPVGASQVDRYHL